jgi:alpha-L-rhamnosidase
LSYVSSRYDSIRGPIESRWERKDGKLTITAAIPPNTTATVYLPTTDAAKVTAGDVALKQSGLKVLELKNGATAVEVGSGKYAFVVTE